MPIEPSPAVSVHKRLKRLRAVGPVGIDAWQRGLAKRFCCRLDFPQKLLGLRVAEIVQVLDLDDVQSSLVRAGIVGLDRPDGCQPIANANGLADLGRCV
jgi:hypothetical protein